MGSSSPHLLVVVSNNRVVVRKWWLVALCLALIRASPAIAECEPPRTAMTALDRADVAFQGTVREIKTVGQPPRPNWRAAWIVWLDVSRIWKGVVGNQFVLHIVRESEDDAFETFERGSEYLVFATRNSERKTARFEIGGPTFGATGCSGTTAQSTRLARTYLLELGAGSMPAR
jgi:hypothetical protein